MAAPYINAEKWRARIRKVGSPFRWWKAVPVEDPRTVTGAEENGRLYVEQTVDSAWRALLYQTEVDYEDKEFGLIAKGTAAIMVMPDEAFLSRLDRVCFTDRKQLSRGLIKRDSSSTDSLIFKPVESVVSVRQGTTVYTPGTDYNLVGDTISWLVSGAHPATGDKYSVEYLYQPVYEFIGSDKAPMPDRNGTMMPQRGALLLYHPSS